MQQQRGSRATRRPWAEHNERKRAGDVFVAADLCGWLADRLLEILEPRLQLAQQPRLVCHAQMREGATGEGEGGKGETGRERRDEGK